MVPYAVSPDRSKLIVPSPPVERVVSPVPSVLTVDTSPLFDVQYRVLPDRPSLPVYLAMPVYRVVNPEPSVLTLNTVPRPELPPEVAVP